MSSSKPAPRNGADTNGLTIFDPGAPSHLLRVKLFGRHGELLQRRRRLVEEELALPSRAARQADKPGRRRRQPRQLRLEGRRVVEHQVAGVSEPHRLGLGIHLPASDYAVQSIKQTNKANKQGVAGTLAHGSFN